MLDQGIKFLLLDVDGTLLAKNKIIVCNNVRNWVIAAKKEIDLHLLSNNPSRNRIKKVAAQLDLDFTYAAAKPSRKALRKVIQSRNYSNNNVAIIGDRIFTDVLAGNRLGIYTILVKPINIRTYPSNKLQNFEKALSKLIIGI